MSIYNRCNINNNKIHRKIEIIDLHYYISITPTGCRLDLSASYNVTGAGFSSLRSSCLFTEYNNILTLAPNYKRAFSILNHSIT